MEITLHNLFPTPILRVKNFLEDGDIDEDFIDGNLHGALSKNAKTSLGGHDGITDNIIQSTKLDDKLKPFLEKYTEIYGIHPVRIFNSWYTIQDKGSILKDHIHPTSIVSGIIYVNVDDKSNETYFYNPKDTELYWKNVNRDTEYNEDWVSFIPEKGDMILFPSWLRHGSNYKENESDNRIIISFNTEYIDRS